MFDIRALRLSWLVEHGHNAEDIMVYTSRPYRNFMFGVVDAYILREQIAADPKKNQRSKPSQQQLPPKEFRLRTHGRIRQQD